MRELVKVLMEKPALLSGMDPAMVEDGMDYMIISVMIELHKMGVIPTEAAIRDELKDFDNSAELNIHLAKRMREVVERDESYIMNVLREDYNKRLIIEISNEALKRVRTESSAEVDKYVREGLSRMSVPVQVTDSRKASVDVMAHLQAIYSGQVPPYWKTDIPELDKVLGLTPRMLYMIAAAQKTGKTRYATSLVMMLMKHQPEMNVIWYSLEMHAVEMSICIIAWLTGISTRVISGKDRMPNKEEMSAIKNARVIMDKLNITFIDKIKPTMDEVRRQVDKMMKPNTVVVIDNLGLLRNDRNMESTSFENANAMGLVDMRDNTDACIIALHHLTKESLSHFNKGDAYEPKVAHIRGSNKWADSVNLLNLLHRPTMYKDLRKAMGEEVWKAAQDKMQVNTPISRDGAQGELILKHDLSTCRFSFSYKEKDVWDEGA